MHDVTDVTCAQSWFNSPLTTSLTADIYKVRRQASSVCDQELHSKYRLCIVNSHASW